MGPWYVCDRAGGVFLTFNALALCLLNVNVSLLTLELAGLVCCLCVACIAKAGSLSVREGKVNSLVV